MSPLRFVSTPPGRFFTAFALEVAGKNWAVRPVNGSQRMCGAMPAPSPEK
ncbi:hypothetical protein BX265_4939 [Streptomyces sp. TLI_235]|nr:hypothetical protein BX265_4939 [Streptomyces sp. TLI_235]